MHQRNHVTDRRLLILALVCYVRPNVLALQQTSKTGSFCSVRRSLQFSERLRVRRNCSGHKFRSAFQDGQCTENGAGGMCFRNRYEAHQCARCLSNAHGATGCTQPIARDKSKGKGKGER